MKLFAAGLMLAAAGGYAAQVGMPQITVQPGASANGQVRFLGQGSQVTALQFDLQYPSNLTVTAAAGAAATAAGKTLSTSAVAAGTMRFIVAGINQTVIGDGAVVTLTIAAPSGAASATSPLHALNLAASNAAGAAVSLTGVDGSVAVQANSNMPSVGAFAHIASGGGWKTSFLVVNLSASATPVRLQFWAEDGSPLNLPYTSPQAGGPPSATNTYVDGTIAASGSLEVDSEAPASGPALVGWTEILTTGNVTGVSIFSLQLQAGGQWYESAVPFENRNSSTFVMPFDQTSNMVAGVALANLSSTVAANINVVIRDEAGNQLATDSVTLAPLGHTSYALSTRLPVTATKRGTLEFQNQSAGNIAALGLRFNGLCFATMPVAIPQ
jgi:hypothetical protein